MNEQNACVSIDGCGIETGPFWVGTLGKKKKPLWIKVKTRYIFFTAKNS